MTAKTANGRMQRCRGTVERGERCKRPVYLQGLCYWCFEDGPLGRRLMLRVEREAARGTS